MSLAIHASTKQQLDLLKQNLPQSLLLSGMSGVGLATIADWLASDSKASQLIMPRLLTKTASIAQIGIDEIRELYESTRGKMKTLHIIIIDDADMMTLSAQHSFLKLLEEPPECIRFILTSHRPEKLLPTIRSRLAHIHIPPLDDQESVVFLDSLSSRLSAQKIQKIQFISKGLPAEMTRLVQNEDYFKAADDRMSTAKRLLTGRQVERMIEVFKVPTNRQESIELIDSMLLLAWRAPSKEAIHRSNQLLNARQYIAGGGNVRLQLLAAMV